jgi:uncharacterized protein involved in exopolysaccharide biosynthesis
MNFDEILDARTWKTALQRWHVLVLVLAASLLLAMLAYALIPPYYHITATVIGTRYQNDITPSNQSMTISATALLGGTQNDAPPITDFRLYTQLLTSPVLGASIVDDPLIHRIFSRSWDKDHWVPPDTLLQHARAFFFSLMGRTAWSAPDGFTVAAYLDDHLTIVSGKDSKILTISTWNRDPEIARALVRLVSARADDIVKLLAQKRFTAKVAFLRKALAQADVQETRLALGEKLAKAETDEIYSFSDLPFAAEFVEPPDGPKRPQFPKFAMLSGILAGLAVIVFLIYIVWIKHAGIAIKLKEGAAVEPREGVAIKPSA